MYYTLVVLMGFGYALLVNGDDFAYDLSMFRAFFQLASAAVCVWLIEKEAWVARPFVIATTSIAILLSILDLFVLGGFASLEAEAGPVIARVVPFAEYVIGAATIVYFIVSPRVKHLFVSHPNWNRRTAPGFEGSATGTDAPIGEKRFSWPWWRNLIIYFCAFSIFGHWAELAFCQLIVWGVVMGDYDYSNVMLWDQWLYPFFAEGIAVVLIAVLLYPIKEWFLKCFDGRILPTLILSFLVNALVCTSIDFTLGITVNADYHLWDYSDLPFNFMGQICLQNSLTYSIAATLIVWIVYPLMERGLNRMPAGLANGLFVGFLAFFLFLEILYYVNIGPTGLVFG